MAYLNESHPEVFFASPRPGGIAKIELPEESVEFKTSKSTLGSKRSLRSTRSLRKSSSRSKSGFPMSFIPVTSGTTCREYRVTTAMISSPWALFDHSYEFPQPPSPAQDVIDLLGIAITTIMLLAAGHGDISIEHKRWTLSYLENIRDEFGNNPPNVMGIINHLKSLDPELESFNDNLNVSIYEDKEEEAVVEEEPPAE